MVNYDAKMLIFHPFKFFPAHSLSKLHTRFVSKTSQLFIVACCCPVEVWVVLLDKCHWHVRYVVDEALASLKHGGSTTLEEAVGLSVVLKDIHLDV